MRAVEYVIAQRATARRAFAVVLLAIGVDLAWFGLVVPARTLALSQDAWREAARSDLARSRGAAAIESEVRERLRGLATAPIWQRLYDNKQANDADVALGQDVTRLANAAGLTLHSLTSVPAANEGLLRKHGVRLAASLSIDQLRQLIAALRAHPRYIRVERLSVAAPQVQPPDRNPVLEIKVDLCGYSRAAVGDNT